MSATGNMTLRSSRRFGFTFIEVTVATAMLAVLLAMFGQLVVLVKRNSRAVEHQTISLRMAENCLEQITSLPWDQINDENIAAFQLPEEVQRRWPQAKLEGEVRSSAEPLPAKQISLRLSLNPESRAPSIKLTTWVYRTSRD